MNSTTNLMSTEEVGQRLVALCNAGESIQAAQELYDDQIVSIEPDGGPEMPVKTEGLQAVNAKQAWWLDNFEILDAQNEGPFIGNKPNQFAVKFKMTVTSKALGREELDELGLYTVRAGKIVQEEFLALNA